VNFATIIVKNLLRRKVRTSLTCAGVAIAISSMVTLIGVSDGFGKATVNGFAQHSVDIVAVEAGKPNQFASDLDVEFADRIRQLPGIKDVAGAMVEFLSTRTKSGNDMQSIVFGWKPETFQFEKFAVEKGRLLKTGDDKVANIGSVMAKNLGKDVGDDIELLDERFKIVRIFSTYNTFENGGIILPLNAMQKLLLRRNSVSGFAIIVDDEAKLPIDKLCSEIEAIRLDTNNIRMQARPTQEYVDSSVHIQIIHVAALLTALIAIASGIISTLNTMSMAVFERFREIGTLRAIGWSKSRIVRMVIGESIVLGMGGAALGIATSLILLRILSIVPQTSGFIDGSLPLFVIGQGFLVAILVGVVGGLVPAYRAARLLPTEALRYE